MELVDIIRRDRLLVASASRRMEFILKDLSLKEHPTTADYDLLAHSCAILTKQLKTLYLRMRDTDQLKLVTFTLQDELKFFESQVLDMSDYFARVVLKSTG